MENSTLETSETIPSLAQRPNILFLETASHAASLGIRVVWAAPKAAVERTLQASSLAGASR